MWMEEHRQSQGEQDLGESLFIAELGSNSRSLNLTSLSRKRGLITKDWGFKNRIVKSRRPLGIAGVLSCVFVPLPTPASSFSWEKNGFLSCLADRAAHGPRTTPQTPQCRKRGVRLSQSPGLSSVVACVLARRKCLQLQSASMRSEPHCKMMAVGINSLRLGTTVSRKDAVWLKSLSLWEMK